jgi:hypothetical protein
MLQKTMLAKIECQHSMIRNMKYRTILLIHMTIMQTRKTSLQIHMSINELWAPLLAIPFFTPG